MKTIVTALALSCAAMTAPAFAQDIEPFQHHHMKLDRDIVESTNRSTSEKLAYVERVAKRACESSGNRSLARRQIERECVADLVENARTQIATLGSDRYADASN